MAFKVLLADDSVPAQNMGKKILTDAGYEVLTASNGLEALRKIADTTPDIAILDIFMPGYTGLEICERLRASAATAELPVILTVGKLEPYRPEDGEHVRSNAVIVKPFAVAELTSAVRSLLGEWNEEDHHNLDAETLLRFGMDLFGAPQEAQAWVLADWTNNRRPALRAYVPYFVHMLSVNIFFCLVIPTQLLRNVKESHQIDLAYLYYLPF